MSGAATVTHAAKPAAIRSGAARIEDSLLTVALLALVALPLSEALLRTFTRTGLPGTQALEQHLTLVIATAGAVVAARDGRLLRLFEFAALSGSRVHALTRWAGSCGAATVAAFLCVACAQLVASERGAASTIALGIPVWLVQCAMPVGFAVIAVRLLTRSSNSMRARLLAVVTVGALLLAAPLWTARPDLGLAPAATGLVIIALCGAPIFAALAGTALLLFWQAGTPIAAVALEHYRMIVNPSLPAIPLFTLAGFTLASSGAPLRLTRLFQELFGHFRGGVAIASVVVGAAFTALTGGSGVTILALGGVLFPLMVAAKYRESDAVGLVTVSGSLGTLVAPCLPLVLYAIIARVELKHMFLGAALPALMMIVLVCAWGVRRDTRNGADLSRFSRQRAREAIRVARWDLALPLVIFASLFGGFATPVEAAALTACYVLMVERFVYGGMRDWRALTGIFSECGALVGGVLLILGVALGLTNYLVDAEWVNRATDWTTGVIHSRGGFLLALNALLLVAGCVMEIWSAIVVLPPLLVPLARYYGVDPVHLGIIFLANLELGYLTPLVGINLFYASARFSRPVLQVCRDVLPLWPILVLCVLLITYLPWLSTWLPHALH